MPTLKFKVPSSSQFHTLYSILTKENVELWLSNFEAPFMKIIAEEKEIADLAQKLQRPSYFVLHMSPEQYEKERS